MRNSVIPKNNAEGYIHFKLYTFVALTTVNVRRSYSDRTNQEHSAQMNLVFVGSYESGSF